MSGCGRTDSETVVQPVTAPAAEVRQVPPAERVLQSLSRSYAEMDAFQVDVVEIISLDREGTRDVVTTRTAAMLARPNRICLPGGDATSVSLHADGVQLWTVLGNRFSMDPCPATMAMIAEDPLRNSLFQASSLFLLRLLDDDAQAAITRDVESIVLLEDAVLEGRSMHHLEFRQADYDWEMWVTVEPPSLIGQIVIDMSRQLGAGLSTVEDARLTTTIRFENWRINPQLDAADFAYQPKAQDRQVPHVMRIGR